jgi:ParB-like chromosome segregation protein Spo0J
MEHTNPETNETAASESGDAPGPTTGTSQNTREEFEVEISLLVHGQSDRGDGVVTDLEESFRAIGQLHPLVVREREDGKYEVLAGNRRLRAARKLGWEKVWVLRAAPDTQKQALVSLDENLAREQLTDLEEAEALVRQKKLYEALFPETKHGGRRSSRHDGGLKAKKKPKSFAKKAAKATGTSERAVQRKTKIAEKAVPAVKAAWDQNEITENQAERLAGLPVAEQQVELQRITADVVPATAPADVHQENPPCAVDVLGLAEKIATDAATLLEATASDSPSEDVAARLLTITTSAHKTLMNVILALRPLVPINSEQAARREVSSPEPETIHSGA